MTLPKPQENEVSIIVAIAQNRVIGNKQQLPWNIPEDMKFFREMTTNSVVIMGRKTFESIGRALPNRVNIIVSRTLPQTIAQDLKNPNIIVAQSLEDAIALAKQEHKPIFIIGGAQLYTQGLTVATKAYITQIPKVYEGDTFFPELSSEWKLTQSKKGEAVEFRLYERKE